MNDPNSAASGGMSAIDVEPWPEQWYPGLRLTSTTSSWRSTRGRPGCPGPVGSSKKAIGRLARPQRGERRLAHLRSLTCPEGWVRQIDLVDEGPSWPFLSTSLSPKESEYVAVARHARWPPRLVRRPLLVVLVPTSSAGDACPRACPRTIPPSTTGCRSRTAEAIDALAPSRDSLVTPRDPKTIRPESASAAARGLRRRRCLRDGVAVGVMEPELAVGGSPLRPFWRVPMRRREPSTPGVRTFD